MARVLCVWEQGANLGHLSHLRLPVELALAAGHTVYVAVRELRNVRLVLGDLPVHYLRSPAKPETGVQDPRGFLSYTHLLDRQCFSSQEELSLYLNAWRTLFDLVQPELVVFEHSPTALIAAHAYAFKKVHIGTGFSVPPIHTDRTAPFLAFPNTQLTPAVVEQLNRDDQQMLARINQALAGLSAPPLPNLHALFGQVNAQWLMTWPELDQFGARNLGPNREQTFYLGVEPPTPRPLPEWPSTPGQKVFAYLDIIPSLEPLLRDLRAASTCCLLYVRGMSAEQRHYYSNDSMQCIEKPVDLHAVAQQADWIVSNAGHSTSAFFARHGVPQLLIPRHQEQLFTALRLVSQGAAAMAFQDQSAYSAAIGAMTGNAQVRVQARLMGEQLMTHPGLSLRAFIRTSLDRLLS